MAITTKSIKLLWSGAAGRCSFANCNVRLSFGEAGEFAPYISGEMAHICGENPGSNRYDASLSSQQKNDYTNLILLCPNHHTLIDKTENEERFPVALLHEMKQAHEAEILQKLDAPETVEAVCREIAPLLADNHQAWRQFGPLSEIAQKNPHSDHAYAAWRSERLSTIVPNNRRIAGILENSRHLFAVGEQDVLSAFFTHVQSYERWVQDECSYEAVMRFPLEFAEIVKRKSDASE